MFEGIGMGLSSAVVFVGLMIVHYAFDRESRRRVFDKFLCFVEPVARFLKRVLRSRWLCRYGVTFHGELLLDSMRMRRSSAAKYRDELSVCVIDATTSIYVPGAGDLVDVSADAMHEYTDRFYRVVRLRDLRKVERFYESELMEA